MKLSRKTKPAVGCGTWTIIVFVGLLVSAMLSPRVYAQAEVDPDHFDSPDTEPVPQSRTADGKVTAARYDRTLSLPYSVLCNGKTLAQGKYSVSLRYDGNVGLATFNQKGRAIEIAGAVKAETSERRDEVAVVENSKNGRTLSVVRVSGVDFIFEPKHRGDPTDSSATRAQELQMTVIALMKSQVKSPR